MKEDLKYLANNFMYKPDGKLDSWRILPMNDLVGDCDDYAVTALYLYCGKSIIKFWFMLITFQAILWFTKSPAGGGHLVLWVRGNGYIDNWDRRWVSRKELKVWGYRFIFPWPFPFVAMKMFFGLFFK